MINRLYKVLDNLGLGSKIYLLLFLTFGVLIFGTGFFVYSKSKATQSKQYLQLVAEQTQDRAAQIQQRFKTIPIDLAYLSQSYELDQFFYWRDIGLKNKRQRWGDLASKAQQKFLGLYPAYSQIQLVSAGGSLLFKSVSPQWSEGLKEISPPVALKSTVKQDHQQIILLSSVQTYVSPLALTTEPGPTDFRAVPTLRFGTQVYGENHVLYGEMILHVLVERLLEEGGHQVERSDSTLPLHYYVLDEQGRVIRHPDLKRDWARLRGVKSRFSDPFPALYAQVQQGEFGSVQAEGWLMSYRKISFDPLNPDRYWVLLGMLPDTGLQATLTQTWWGYGLFFMVFFLLVTFGTRKLIEPKLAAMRTAAEQIADLSKGGTVTKWLVYESTDEIGVILKASADLAQARENLVNAVDLISTGEYDINVPLLSKADQLGRAIQHMATSLKENHTQLQQNTWQQESLGQLGALLTGELSAVEVGEKVITFLGNQFALNHGLFYHYLLGDIRPLELIASYMGSPADQKVAELALGEGLAGQVALDQQMIHITELGLKQETVLPYQSYGFPLLYKGELCGVVVLKTASCFETVQLDLLNRMIEPISASLIARQQSDKIHQLLTISRKAAFKSEEETQRTLELNQQLASKQALLAEQADDLKLRNEQLNNSQKELELANRYKNDFLANMSHEIRTPINAVIGMTEIALDEPVSESIREILQTINIEGDSLLSLVNDILDLSKVESGRFELEKVSFDFREIIEDLAHSFSYRCQTKGLGLYVFVTPAVPERLLGDPVRVRQIIVNLLGNALKFTDQGKISVMLDVEKQDKNVVTLRCEVEDTGVGIAPEHLDKIFESFTQADSSTTRLYGGTGLGTTLAKQFVRHMGGDIGVHSTLGKGSTFWFNLPLEKVNVQGLESSTDLKGKQALVIESPDPSEKALASYLKTWEVNFKVVTDPDVSVTELAKEMSEVDFIVFNGANDSPETERRLKELREQPCFSKTALLVLDFQDSAETAQAYQRAGASHFLRCPFQQQELFELLIQTSDPNSLARLKVDFDDSAITKERLAKVHILLVEDYPTNQRVALSHLGKAGFQVDLAKNGLEAVELFQAKTYQLILMDIQMPLLDGFGATAQIRQLERQRSETQSTPMKPTPIIAMTAHAMASHKAACLQAGMDGYISKPMRKQQLLSLVLQWTLAQEDSTAKTQEAPPKPQPEEVPLFDRALALEEFENDIELFEEVLKEYREHVSEQLKAMTPMLQQKQYQELAGQAHSIKGGAANLYATQLANAASQLEQSARKDPPEHCHTELTELIRIFEQFDQLTQ